MRELEQELQRTEIDDPADDPDAMMRAATVRMHEAKESKFLGPSSGIAITRLVMQLAKQFTDSRSIKEIVPEHRARQIKELYHQEQAKPTSKVYPLISDVPALELPNRPLTDLLVQLYKLKVQPMYPALHEPTLEQDIETVYQIGPKASSYQQFVCRMVIAISLQKMDTQYAGLADSYYLAALQHLQAVVKPMDLKTLQCFALMAEYSLLTPTRTAIYYVMGIAVRLVQALGYNEEKTITRKGADGIADVLEIDMRRRLFYCILVMDFGLAHSLGRPAMLSTNWDHIDVGWFETCDDKHITRDGIDPAAQRPTLKKWVAIHFFKMRMLQLEIRRKLYLNKRPEPRSDSDKWFIDMEAKLIAWRDAAPSGGEGFGLDKVWFIARFNTMVVFLFRPSPQVPRPSLQAALKCYEACEYNIHVQREQISRRNVDLTWVFTQAIFLTINTTLWTLSYDEVRRKYNREAVEGSLEVAMDSIKLAAERWPGVASAIQLYNNLIEAIMKIHEKDGDVPIAAASPSAAHSDNLTRSRTTSPATAASSSIATPPDRPPFGYLQQQYMGDMQQPPPLHYGNEPGPYTVAQQASQMSQIPSYPSAPRTYPAENVPLAHQSRHDQSPYRQPPPPQQQYFDPYTQFNPLPQFTHNLAVPGWTTTSQQRHLPSAHAPIQQQYPTYNNHPIFDPNNAAYPFPATFDANTLSNEPWMQDWDFGPGSFGTGLNQTQQAELMQSLETDGMEDIQSMIANTLSSITPKAPRNAQFGT